MLSISPFYYLSVVQKRDVRLERSALYIKKNTKEIKKILFFFENFNVLKQLKN